MAKKQQLLKDLWLSAIPGHLSPWQQAKALALREVNMELHGGKVHLSWICARLTKGGGGQWGAHIGGAWCSQGYATTPAAKPLRP